MTGDLCNVTDCHFNDGRTCQRLYLKGEEPAGYCTESCDDRCYVKKFTGKLLRLSDD